MNIDGSNTTISYRRSKILSIDPSLIDLEKQNNDAGNGNGNVNGVIMNNSYIGNNGINNNNLNSSYLGNNGINGNNINNGINNNISNNMNNNMNDNDKYNNSKYYYDDDGKKIQSGLLRRSVIVLIAIIIGFVIFIGLYKILSIITLFISQLGDDLSLSSPSSVDIDASASSLSLSSSFIPSSVNNKNSDNGDSVEEGNVNANNDENDNGNGSDENDENDSDNSDDDDESESNDNTINTDNNFEYKKQLYLKTHTEAQYESLNELQKRVLFDLSPLSSSTASSSKSISSLNSKMKMKLTNNRRESIKDAFIHAWDCYEKYALGMDNVKPISKKGSNSFLGMSITLVDSMDTTLIMGLNDIFMKQVEWIDKNLVFNNQGDCNVFETTIRVIGSLLSCYYLVDDVKVININEKERIKNILVNKAVEIADILLISFDTPTGYPYGTVNIKQRRAFNPSFTSGSTISEVGTLLLEFRELSRVTKNNKYENAVNKIRDNLYDEVIIKGKHKLFPMFIDPKTGIFKENGMITFGARGDSIYEYFLKGYIQTGNKDEKLKQMYDETMKEMKKRLLKRTNGSMKLSYIAEEFLTRSSASSLRNGLSNNARVEPKMDHLVCFLPGLLALGAKEDVEAKIEEMEEKDIMTSSDDDDSQSDALIGDDNDYDVISKKRNMNKKSSSSSSITNPKSQLFDRLLSENDDFKVAQELAETCYKMYELMPTGLAPEISYFNDIDKKELIAKQGAYHSLLRPEAVESLFIMWRITHNEKYREYVWNIFKAIIDISLYPSCGFSSISDVTIKPNAKPVQRIDNMESFFLAETLKYIYLTFCDDSVIDLDSFVFNTEAHPIPIWK